MFAYTLAEQMHTDLRTATIQAIQAHFIMRKQDDVFEPEVSIMINESDDGEGGVWIASITKDGCRTTGDYCPHEFTAHSFDECTTPQLIEMLKCLQTNAGTWESENEEEEENND